MLLGRRKEDDSPDAVGRVGDDAGSAVLFKNHLHQVKAKAAAAGPSVPGALLTVKWLEKMGEGVFVDVNARIFNGENGAIFMKAAPYPNLRALRGVEGSVGKKVFHGPGQQRPITTNTDPRLQMDA